MPGIFRPGLQRARRDAIGAVDQRSIACALTAAAAKTLATDILARAEAARWQIGVRLPWRHLGVRPGARVQIESEPGIWRVRQTRFESLIVHLDLQRVESGLPVVAESDSGRAQMFDDSPAGETSLLVLDLPPLSGDVPSAPRLWIAAAGASSGWRRAAVEASADAGISYAGIGTVTVATPLGSAVTRMPAGPVDVWDRFSAVEVELLADAMWLEGRPDGSVLAGSNLALVGNEIIQFANAEALAPRRFRLSGLLRGRSGTEAAIGGHVAGERFVLLDRMTLLPFDPPFEALGRALQFRSAGGGDVAASAVVAQAGGAALRPLSPAHLRLQSRAGDVVARWVRRSRAGFDWPDFVDAPLAEAGEFYRVEVTLDGRPARTRSVTLPEYVYTAADRAADGDGSVVGISVSQMSAAVGPGTAIRGSIGFGI